MSSDMIEMCAAAAQRGRGAALLAFAGRPVPEDFATMVACAENLDRDLVAVTAGARPGGVITTDRELAVVVAALRRCTAAIVVVAGATPPVIVRRLASATRRPVLVARTRQPWERVLAATDLQTRGLPVVEAAVALAEPRRAQAIALHNVAPTWSTPSAIVGDGAVVATRVARRLRRLARAASRTTPAATVIVVSAGVPSRAIVDAVVARDADVVVVGMRPPLRRGRRRCADHVVAATPGNVLVVPLRARSGRHARRARS